MINKIILLVTAAQWALSFSTAEELVITIPDGQIQGATYLTPNNKTYYGFRGIPYAKPPLGNLRFDAPQPPQPWSEILDATRDSSACISIAHSLTPDSESEDCLYINVYTPILKPDDKLPVLFWIYGGAFTMGHSSKFLYGPDFLIEEDIILVTFNYRLGPFGFLSTGDTVIPGNAGLKDQNLALKWTRDNIGFFGGDSDKITIFGQSAGATSIGHHILSKKSTGLFRAAIIESGSAIIPGAIRFDPRSYAFLLANAIPGGNYGNDTKKLKDFLLGQTVDALIDATVSLPSDQHVSPVIETQHEGAFLTESPYELLESGRFNQVPLVIGICAEESLTFLKDLETAKQNARSHDANPSSLIPANLLPNSSDVDLVIDKIKNTYLNGSQLFSSDLVGLANYYTDNYFTRGIIKHAELSSKYVPVYLYQFAYYGRIMTQAFIDGAEKAAHSAEIPFLFHITGFDDSDPTNLITQNRIVRLWTNFAKFVNPTPKKLELFNNVTWSTINPTKQPFLNINGTMEVRFDIRKKTYPRWNEIFEDYGRKPFITY